LAKNTREELIEVARRQFAQKGFYGTSIAGIANELGLSKQALLHHFGTKEKLYAQVLSEISGRYVARIFQVQLEISDPRQQLEELMLDQLSQQSADHNDARVVMRELLDNQNRAEQVTNWYLKPYLNALASIVKRIEHQENFSDAEALAVVYQLLGAINYLGMSEPTLTQMFGKATFEALCVAYPRQLRALIRSRFAAAE
tara:strand:+ start:9183 stop:9782 length:600 start_codon:yes stop_codon:yes gene_type:complete